MSVSRGLEKAICVWLRKPQADSCEIPRLFWCVTTCYMHHIRVCGLAVLTDFRFSDRICATARSTVLRTQHALTEWFMVTVGWFWAHARGWDVLCLAAVVCVTRFSLIFVVHLLFLCSNVCVEGRCFSVEKC